MPNFTIDIQVEETAYTPYDLDQALPASSLEADWVRGKQSDFFFFDEMSDTYKTIPYHPNDKNNFLEKLRVAGLDDYKDVIPAYNQQVPTSLLSHVNASNFSPPTSKQIILDNDSYKVYFFKDEQGRINCQIHGCVRIQTVGESEFKILPGQLQGTFKLSQDKRYLQLINYKTTNPVIKALLLGEPFSDGMFEETESEKVKQESSAISRQASNDSGTSSSYSNMSDNEGVLNNSMSRPSHTDVYSDAPPLSANKTVRVFSIDFDGCLSRADLFPNIETVENPFIEETLDVIENGNQYLWNNFSFCHDDILMNGSNRQTPYLEAINTRHNKVAWWKLFHPLAGRLQVTADDFVLADAYRNPSHSDQNEILLQGAEKKLASELRQITRAENYDEYCDLDTKIGLLYTQMHRAYQIADAKEIEFNFFDDHLDGGTPILSDLYKFYSTRPNLIPFGVTLKLWHYTGDKPETVEVSIKGSGSYNPCYARVAKDLASKEEEIYSNEKIPKRRDLEQYLSEHPIVQLTKIAQLPQGFNINELDTSENLRLAINAIYRGMPLFKTCDDNTIEPLFVTEDEVTALMDSADLVDQVIAISNGNKQSGPEGEVAVFPSELRSIIIKQSSENRDGVTADEKSSDSIFLSVVRRTIAEFKPILSLDNSSSYPKILSGRHHITTCRNSYLASQTKLFTKSRGIISEDGVKGCQQEMKAAQTDCLSSVRSEIYANPLHKITDLLCGILGKLVQKITRSPASENPNSLFSSKRMKLTGNLRQATQTGKITRLLADEQEKESISKLRR